MARRNIVGLAIALVLGMFAVIIANAWFSGVEERQERTAESLALTQIVVAGLPLEFGTRLTSDNVRLVSWPADSVPSGAFTDAGLLVNGTRVALRPVAAGEPILADKVSGSDGRAVISANIPDNMRAKTIPVDAVTGVAGFVVPGDVVDVMLTRTIPGEGASATDKMTTVVMESVQVLAIDQLADESETDPKVGTTATLLVDLFGAQKLELARQIGSLSLALRNVEDQLVGATDIVTPSDLGGSGYHIAGRRSAAAAPAPPPVYAYPPVQQAEPAPARAPAPRKPSGPTMTIIRGVEGTQYEVNRYGRF